MPLLALLISLHMATYLMWWAMCGNGQKRPLTHLKALMFIQFMMTLPRPLLTTAIILLKAAHGFRVAIESHADSRYAFRRHFFQHAGFRYIATNNTVNAVSSRYETDKFMSEYAEFHYGDSYFGVENFSAALAKLAVHHTAQRPARLP
jgi:hypothetical protein